MLLSNALIGWPVTRSVKKMSDHEYVSCGKRSNSEQLAAADDTQLFEALRLEECLDDVLEVPYALRHVKDVHSAMQVAVSRVGEQRDELTRNSLFHPAFAAFTLGFAIGVVTQHRFAHGDLRMSIGRPSKRQVEQCNEWGIAVALYCLVCVESCGIIDSATDFAAYGIESKWRLVADERRLEPFPLLSRCTNAGKSAAELWSKDETVELGGLLSATLEQFIATYPDSSFE